jgi:hypothetical protein
VRIIPDLSEVREDYEATGTEKQDKGDTRAPSNPLARHAVEHHDSTSPAYTVPRPLVLACFGCIAEIVAANALSSPYH